MNHFVINLLLNYFGKRLRLLLGGERVSPILDALNRRGKDGVGRQEFPVVRKELEPRMGFDERPRRLGAFVTR